MDLTATDLLNSAHLDAATLANSSSGDEAAARVERLAESARRLEESVASVEADTRALVVGADTLPEEGGARATDGAEESSADATLERAAREQLAEVARRESALLELEATRLRRALDAVRAGFEQLRATHLSVSFALLCFPIRTSLTVLVHTVQYCTVCTCTVH